MENDIKVALAIGQNMKDITTQFTGLCVQKVEQFGGNVRFVIQGQPEPGKVGTSFPDALEIDEVVLELVPGSPHAGRVIPANDTSGIELGNQVQDQITKFIGIATDRIIHMNGCVFYRVVPVHSGKGWQADANPRGSHISAKLLKVTGPGLVVEQKELAKKPSGGMSTKAERY